ncbi:hypothetical protein EQH71_02680 [Pseudomonas aeruginosa]|nr:hypothetical protein EQH71_02680 [Pseudomonas aeruginosa]
MSEYLQFAIWAVIILVVGHLIRPRDVRKWLGIIAFVAAWVLVFFFSSIELAGFDLGILGICLCALGVDLFARRDRFSK